jgi:hypothetical protein
VLALDNALRAILSGAGTVAEQGLWLHIAATIERARQPYQQQADELLDKADELPEGDELRANLVKQANGAVANIPVVLSNHVARLLWEKLLDLQPADFGVSRDQAGRPVSTVPAPRMLALMLEDFAFDLGKVPPWVEDDEAEGEESGDA